MMNQLRQEIQDLDPHLELWTELEMLEVSILRGKGETENARDLLFQCEEKLREDKLPLPFQLYFQKGLNHLKLDEISPALEAFLKAREKAKTAFQILPSSINTLLCLENLGLPFEKVLQEIESNLQTDPSSEEAKKVHKILATFYQRQAFRTGDIASVVRKKPLVTEIKQYEYYQLWVTAMPFVHFHWPERPDIFGNLAVSSSLHLKKYRLKTLSSDERITEEREIPTMEKIDRIYLWTWRWLQDPSEKNRQLLRETLLNFNYQGALKRMTCEDVQMMRNSFSWICLFQPTVRARFQNFLSLIESQRIPDFPLFQFENLWIQLGTLFKNKNHRDQVRLQKSIQRMPLASIKQLDFKSFFKSLRPSLIDPHLSKKHLWFDMTSGKISSPSRLPSPLISKPMAGLLHALILKTEMTFDEAMRVAFQIQPYDASVHSPKIHNLITRLRKALPLGVNLQSRDQVLYLFGDLDLVREEKKRGHLIPLFDESDSPGGSSPGEDISFSSKAKLEYLDRWVQPRIVLRKALGKKNLSRHDLQKMTKASKATANRWINIWIAQGLIRKQGVGKSTTYHIEIS